MISKQKVLKYFPDMIGRAQKGTNIKVPCSWLVSYNEWQGGFYLYYIDKKLDVVIFKNHRSIEGVIRRTSTFEEIKHRSCIVPDEVGFKMLALEFGV